MLTASLAVAPVTAAFLAAPPPSTAWPAADLVLSPAFNAAPNPLELDQWASEREPIRRAQAAREALEDLRVSEAVRTVAGRAAAPEAPYSLGSAPRLAGLDATGLPPDVQLSIELLVATAQHVRDLHAQDGVEAAAGALVMMAAIEEALPALRAYASSFGSPSEQPPVDTTPLREAFHHIAEARKESPSFTIDGEAMRAYEEWALNEPGPIPPEHLNAEFHKAIHDHPFHAAQEARGTLEAYLAEVDAYEPPLSPPAADGVHQSHCSVAGPILIEDPGPTCLFVVTMPGAVNVVGSPCDPGPTVGEPVILIDLGSPDLYCNHVAGASGPGDVEVVIDVGGADAYVAWVAPVFVDDPTYPDEVAQGAGTDGGIGILVDVDGSDLYTIGGVSPLFSPSRGQGYGETGAGILVDLLGPFDSYILLDLCFEFLDPKPLESHAFCPDVGVRGQGAADASGLGVQIDVVGFDFYAADATTVASQFFGPFIPRPDGTAVLHTARSGQATTHVQGAAEGQSVAANLDVDAALGPIAGLPGGAFYSAFGLSSATAVEESFITRLGSRTCIAESDDVLVRAQGAAEGGALALHSSGFAFRFAFGLSIAFGECFELGFTDFNAHMQSVAHSGDAAVQAQGAGLDGGVAGLLQADVFGATNFAFADSAAVACSNCFQSGGNCNAQSLAGRAHTVAQGAGMGGEGILVGLEAPLFGFTLNLADAFDSSSTMTLLVAGGTGMANSWFEGNPSPPWGPLVPGPYPFPLPTTHAQGAAAGGIGALVEAAGSAFYSATASRFVFESDPSSFTALALLGRDFDKAEVDGNVGVAVFADLGCSPDFYFETGNPFSGAADSGCSLPGGLLALPLIWGTLAGSGEFLEVGIDA